MWLDCWPVYTNITFSATDGHSVPLAGLSYANQVISYNHYSKA